MALQKVDGVDKVIVDTTGRMVIEPTSKKVKFQEKALTEALGGRLAVKKLKLAKQTIAAEVCDVKISGFS